jgi:hypothetical protein
MKTTLKLALEMRRARGAGERGDMKTRRDAGPIENAAARQRKSIAIAEGEGRARHDTRSVHTAIARR